MVNPVQAVQKVLITIILLPLAIMLIASLLAYVYFYFTTGGFIPSLADRLLGLNPASIYILLSMFFGLAALAVATCGCVIFTAVEVYRIRKSMENPDRVFK